MKVLIFGCSSLSANLVEDLSGKNNEITVLGDNREYLEKIEPYIDVRVVLTAEPIMRDYLQEGNIDHCDIFLAISDDDHQNILVSQIAKYIYNVPKVICHLNSPQLQVMYAALGLDVIGYSFGLLQDVRQVIQRTTQV